MDEQTEYQRTVERVRALRGFYVHLMVYVAVNLGLVAIHWLTEPPGLTWSYYPLVGWGWRSRSTPSPCSSPRASSARTGRSARWRS